MRIGVGVGGILDCRRGNAQVSRGLAQRMWNEKWLAVAEYQAGNECKRI